MVRFYLLMIVTSITADNIQKSSFPNLSIIKSGSRYSCTINNDTLGSALTWNNQTTDAPSNNIYCGIHDGNMCTLMAPWDSWKWKHEGNMFPILDYRWQSFPTLLLSTRETQLRRTMDKNFQLSFSVKAAELQILFWNDNNGTTPNSYLIGLGGNSNQTSYVQKCTYYRNMDEGLKDKCSRNEVEFKGIVINETQWNHFTILKNGTTITVWKYDRLEPILNYTDVPPGIPGLEYMIARRSNTTGKEYMKVHKVNVLTTHEHSNEVSIGLDEPSNSTTCLALYVKACKNCSLTVKLLNGKDVLNETMHENLGESWQEIFLRYDKNWSSVNKISIKTVAEVQGKPDELYWQISETLRKCGSADIAMKYADRPDDCCHALKYPNHSICASDMKDYHKLKDSSCPSNTIGNNCIPCASISDDQSCNNSKVCDLTSNGIVCSCGQNSNATDCLEASAPAVQNIWYNATDTAVQLKWKINKTDNVKEYLVKYTHHRYRMCTKISEGRASKNITTTNTDVTIDNLLPFVEYVAEISAINQYVAKPTIIQFQTKETLSPNETELPEITFGESEKYLNLNLTWSCYKLKGPLKFKAELSCTNEWCSDLSEHYNGEVLEDRPRLSNIKFHIIGRTNYELKFVISRNSNKSFFTKTFTSASKAPGTVRNVAIYSRTNTSVGLRWLPPYPPEGDIESYWIQINGSSAELRIESSSFCKVWPEYICAKITELKPNLQYRFKVRARNLNVTVSGLYTADILTYTKEQAPAAPEDVTLTWDQEYGLTVRWRHPTKAYEAIRQFLLYVNSKMTASYEVKEENPHYEYKLSIPENLTFQQLVVGVASQNSAGNSTITSTHTYSPPKPPKFVTEPFVEEVNDTSFSIRIPRIVDIEGVSYMYIIVTNIQRNVTGDLHPMERKLFEEIDASISNSWTVQEFNLIDATNMGNFSCEIGNGSKTNSEIDRSWKLTNRMLNPENTYNVTIVFSSTYQTFSRYRFYRLDSIVLRSDVTYMIYLFVLALVVLTMPCILLVKLKITKMNCPTIRSRGQNLGTQENSNQMYMNALRQQTASLRSITLENDHVLEQTDEMRSRPVLVEDLYGYVKNALKNDEFERQHESLPKGQVNHCIYGSMSQNETKNRNSDLLPYDCTRVKLNVVNKDPFTNYINANYIDGYNYPRRYIATQTPKPNTLNDFWRMIWHKRVEYIVVIASTVNDDENYWPIVNHSRLFGNIKVEYVSVDVMAHYQVRCFSVQFDNEKRKVEQIYFFSLSNRRSFVRVQIFSTILKKVLSLPPTTSPIVVHCSDEIDYTGSLILCDICLRMAGQEDKVDVLHYLHKIRQQRINMVEDVEQYKLVHLALLQRLVGKRTGILCNESMHEKIDAITVEKLKEEMKYLDDCAWQDEALRETSPIYDIPVVPGKNRFQNILPDPNSRVDLSPYPSSDSNSAYINAITVDGFLKSGSFIVTQNPLHNTIGDFWRLIDEKKITLVICLNHLDLQDNDTCMFYPTRKQPSVKPVPYLEVKYVEEVIDAYYDIHKLTLTRLCNQVSFAQRKIVNIRIIHLKIWHFDEIHPENPIGLLMAYEEISPLEREADSILVTCHNGTRASGLFVTMCFVLDKIKVEHICDVCLAVRITRTSRKQFVRQKEQLGFLYRCASEYLRSFDTYSVPLI